MGESILEDTVSCLMPVYNVESYVEDAINSILHQSYKNIELIIIDDCSSDNTYNICKKMSLLDSRIILFRNSRNLKIEKTLNKALRYASGKYIIRMDGDDLCDFDRIMRMKKYLDENQDIQLVGTSTFSINARGDKIGQYTALSDFDKIKKTMLIQTPVQHIWMTYKSVYDDLNGYRYFGGAEDYDFVLRVITKGYKVSNISDYYAYSVRINRPNNTVNILGLEKIRASMYAKKMCIERLKNGFDSYSLTRIKKYIIASNFSQIVFRISNQYLYNAIDAKATGNVGKLIFYISLSLISPYQVKYLLDRFRFKYLIR